MSFTVGDEGWIIRTGLCGIEGYHHIEEPSDLTIVLDSFYMCPSSSHRCSYCVAGTDRGLNKEDSAGRLYPLARTMRFENQTVYALNCVCTAADHMGCLIQVRSI